MTHLLAQILWNPALNSQIGHLTSPSQVTSNVLQIFITNGMTVVFGLGGLVLIIMLLIGAYEFITAGGDKEAIQKSTKRITQALIGIAILLSIYLIINVISTLFGINLLSVNIPLLPAP